MGPMALAVNVNSVLSRYRLAYGFRKSCKFSTLEYSLSTRTISQTFMKPDRDMMANLHINIAMPAQESLIKALLAQHRLPSDDIAHHLRHFHVADLHGRVVGAVGLEIYPPFALVRSLVVSQDLWGQGVARQLYKRCESYARRQGATSLYLLTLTAPDFFSKRGFVEIDRSSVPDEIRTTREFAEICPASATCMFKHLIDPAENPIE